MAETLKASPIQKHLEIEEIKNDVIILKNKGLRAILMANSINLALKSTDEQKALIFRYQDFLNSLEFPVQIVVNSRKFDISQYLDFVRQKAAEQENELLKIQTIEYMDFVRGLTQLANIMSDSFYVVVPYNPPAVSTKGFLDRILGKSKQTETPEQGFEEFKNNLWQRVDFVITGLLGMGITAAPLKTNELIELFYRLYNPGAKEKITKTGPEKTNQRS